MEIKYELKVSREKAISILNELINDLEQYQYLDTLKEKLKETNKILFTILHSSDIAAMLNRRRHYPENKFSSTSEINYALRDKESIVDLLELILRDIEMKGTKQISVDDDFELETALGIIRKILYNFYSHIEVMYEIPIHGSAGIKQNDLNRIKIVNEYDVQRILYSLIKPIFPEARVEVSEDTGFASIRVDIIIEKYDIVVEAKCSRMSMSEKSLTEEIGADITHYNRNNIFFFVYDKEKIVRNRVAFVDTYTCKVGSKRVETILIQPITL